MNYVFFRISWFQFFFFTGILSGSLYCDYCNIEVEKPYVQACSMEIIGYKFNIWINLQAMMSSYIIFWSLSMVYETSLFAFFAGIMWKAGVTNCVEPLT